MNPLAPRHVATVALLLACAACSDDETPPEVEPPALDVALVVDPNQSTEAALAERLTRLVLVVDAATPLYQAGEERADGGVQVKNADADPNDLELVATIPVEGSTLPTFRLAQGGLPDVPIDLRVLGFDETDAIVAEGALLSARFAATPRAVELPFALRASELPPRVVDLLPAEGTDIGTECVLDAVVIVFSRAVDGASLRDPGAIVLDPYGAPADVVLDATGLVATVALDDVRGAGELAFRLRVDATVRSAGDGVSLDQVPAESGAQPFVRDLRLPCRLPTPTLPCGGPTQDPCPEPCGGVAFCPPDPRVACVDGRCIPTTCAPCDEGSVCDPATIQCTIDCRGASAIEGCDPDMTCDRDSGLCER